MSHQPDLRAGDLIIQPSATVMYLSDDQGIRKEIRFAPPKGRKFAALLLGTVPARPTEHINVSALMADLGVFAENTLRKCAADLGYPEADVELLLAAMQRRAKEL